MIDLVRQRIIEQVAKETGLDIETVAECWDKFESLPLETQDRALDYYSDVHGDRDD